MMITTHRAPVPASATWRFKLGIVLLCVIPALWALVPLAMAAEVPGSTIAAITGALFIVNKVLLLVIAVMGKAGFQQLKQFLQIKRGRYRR